jgi:hypothetical protein
VWSIFKTGSTLSRYLCHMKKIAVGDGWREPRDAIEESLSGGSVWSWFGEHCEPGSFWRLWYVLGLCESKGVDPYCLVRMKDMDTWMVEHTWPVLSADNVCSFTSRESRPSQPFPLDLEDEWFCCSKSQNWEILCSKDCNVFSIPSMRALRTSMLKLEFLSLFGSDFGAG